MKLYNISYNFTNNNDFSKIIKLHTLNFTFKLFIHLLSVDTFLGIFVSLSCAFYLFKIIKVYSMLSPVAGT